VPKKKTATKRRKRPKKPEATPLTDLRAGGCFQRFKDPMYPEDGVHEEVYLLVDDDTAITMGNVRLGLTTARAAGLKVKSVSCRLREEVGKRRMLRTSYNR